MKFNVLALDYDGTIAHEGKIDPDVKKAISEVRARGIAVIVVTGRILADLQEVARSLDFADAIVAENGAVVNFADRGSRLLGQAPPATFVEDLRRCGISFKVGQCVVETDASAAPQMLAVIRNLQLPLVLLFNRSRVMVLPQAISKGVGLREALSMLHLSPHNAIAIGDAENDHDLLGTCEFGVAVGWGSRALQETADAVLPGDGPQAVAGYIRTAAKAMRLPPERLDRSRMVIGTTDDGYPLALSMRGRNLLIVGDPQSGKSWVAGLICEQLILQGYTLCVIDAEGDYQTLESLPGSLVLGSESSLPELSDVARVLRHPHMSVVLDLSHISYRDKVTYLDTLLPMLASLRRATGLPHRIVVDEAHYFLHEPNVRELVDFDLGAYTFVTYRLSDLHPDIRRAIEGVIVKRTTDPREIQTLLAMVGNAHSDSKWRSAFASLSPDEAILLPGIDEAGAQFRRFRLALRSTMHVRHRAKYIDMELLSTRAFVFTDNGVPVGTPARTLNEFVSSLKVLPLSVLDGHARRGDFSQWIGDVFHDHSLASDIRKVEQRYLLGHTRDLYKTITESITQRYELSSEVHEPEEAAVVFSR